VLGGICLFTIFATIVRKKLAGGGKDIKLSLRASSSLGSFGASLSQKLGSLVSRPPPSKPDPWADDDDERAAVAARSAAERAAIARRGSLLRPPIAASVAAAGSAVLTRVQSLFSAAREGRGGGEEPASRGDKLRAFALEQGGEDDEESVFGVRTNKRTSSKKAPEGDDSWMGAEEEEDAEAAQRALKARKKAAKLAAAAEAAENGDAEARAKLVRRCSPPPPRRIA